MARSPAGGVEARPRGGHPAPILSENRHQAVLRQDSRTGEAE